MITLSALGISLAVNLVLYRWALPIGIMDVPCARSVHTRITPRTGGIAIMLAFLAGVVLAKSFGWLSAWPGYLGPMLVLFILGLADDRYGVCNKRKAMVVLLVSGALVAQGNQLAIPGLLAFPMSVLFVGATVCGSDFVDGLDSLATGLHLVIFGALATVGLHFGDPILAGSSILISAALCGFLAFNVRPARLFMGDAGAMCLGLLAAWGALRASAHLPVWAPLILLALPLGDFVITLTRRTLQGHSPFRADKQHLHHQMLNLMGHSGRAVATLVAIQFLLVSFLLLRALNE